MVKARSWACVAALWVLALISVSIHPRQEAERQLKVYPGGSVRIPAAYNGLFGLRPTLHRLPYAGARNTLLGLESIASALGPLSHSMSGIELFTKAVLDSKPWFLDPKVPEMPWRQDMVDLKHLVSEDGSPRKPVFGIMQWDDKVMPWPPVRKAIQTAVDAVKKQGFEGERAFLCRTRPSS